MPVDIIHQANMRDAKLIELGGIVDQSGRMVTIAHELYIPSVESKKAMASGNRQLIVNHCYIANTYRTAASTSTRGSQNTMVLPPVLVPKGTVFMTSEHGTRMRMNGGFIVLVNGYTAAEMWAKGTHRPSTKDEVVRYKDERRRSVEEIKVKEEELHPEKKSPVFQFQSPEGYSKLTEQGLLPDQVIITRSELSNLISRGVEEYLNKVTSSGDTSNKPVSIDGGDGHASNGNGNGNSDSTGPIGATGPITSLDAKFEDGMGGPTYDDADETAVISGNSTLTSPVKISTGKRRVS